MKRGEYVDIGPHRLYYGDCREIIPTLDSRDIDAIVTDIPYNISENQRKWYNGNTPILRRLDYGIWDGIDGEKAAYEAIKLLDHIPTIIAWCGYKQYSIIADLLKDRSERMLIWAKTNPTVLNGDKLYLPATECAYYGKMAGAWFGGNCVKSYWIGNINKNRLHPTQKPIGLMTWCVLNICPPNGNVLDPFSGSASTGIACHQTGRRYIGIEIDPEYFEIGRHRMESAIAHGYQPPLFADAMP